MTRILRLTVLIGAVVLVAVPAIMALVGLIRLPTIDSDATATVDDTTTGGSEAAGGSGTSEATEPGAWDLTGPQSGEGRTVRGVSCRRTGASSFDVIDESGEEPSSMMTVAVDLVDEAGVRHHQVVALASTGAGPRGAMPIWGPSEVGDIEACRVTAVQVGDRVTYTGW